ncbi:MAG: glycoside hydrolase family 28 protein [Bacteroidales bacterium]|nr:glycoside hydrolase family 28 protein [Bacteroidales bacterium]
MKRFILIVAAAMSVSGLFAQEPARIPDNSVSLMDYGAVADGITLNTEAFSNAVKALVKKGGGHLIVPEGLFLSGPIVLKDNIDLHLERGAFILFSPNKADFLVDGKVKPCISASKRHDVSISGEGIIDGNGEWWRAVKRGKVSDVEWADYKRMGGTVTEDGKLWYPFGLNFYADIADDYRAQEKMRTHLVRFTECERVTVSGVTLQNSPKFHLVPQRCKDVLIEGVVVRCPWNAQNGDGIDIMSSRNVVVRGCMVDVGDDGICLKAGGGPKGVEDGPCKNVLVENNTVFHAHGGFVIGSEFSGGMEDIVVRHNTFSGTDTGLRFKSAPERGGKCSNIHISDIIMSDIRGEAIVFETTYANRPAGYEDAVAPESLSYLPEFCDIVIERVVCRDARIAVRAAGNIGMIHDISVRNSVFFYTEQDRLLDDPAMISFTGVSFTTFPVKCN